MVALDRRVDPVDLRWLAASEACLRSLRVPQRRVSLRERLGGWFDLALVLVLIVAFVGWGRVQGA